MPGCNASDLTRITPAYRQNAIFLKPKLERIKKYCSHPVRWNWQPVLLIFGVVSAQSQVTAAILLRQSLAKKSKLPAPNGSTIF